LAHRCSITHLEVEYLQAAQAADLFFIPPLKEVGFQIPRFL
jgi:hypothetical protein